MWAYITLLAVVALILLWINAAPTYRYNLQQRLEPLDADGDDDNVADSGDANATVGARGDADAPGAKQPTTPGDGDDLPRVVIFCPGRNEAEHIRQTLPEICGQDYPDYRVVYIDDHSDDDTPAITTQCQAAFDHLVVVRNDVEPPAGWVGKCWAIQRGYEAWRKIEADDASSRAAGPVDEQIVCFTDADVHWHRQCLRRAVEAMRDRNADVLSLLPGMTFGAALERLVISVMTMAIFVLFPLKRAMDPNDPEALLAGAFALVRRGLYDRIGGHAAVADRVVEDINLGRKLKAAGGRLWVGFAPQLIYGRMYDGWADMWEGLTKNAYAGMEYRPFTAVYLITTLVLVNILPPVYLLASVIWLALSPSPAAGAAVALSGCILLLQARLMNACRTLLRLPARYALAMPIGSAVYLPIVLGSIWRYYRGGNVWKGRSYGRAFGRASDAA